MAFTLSVKGWKVVAFALGSTLLIFSLLAGLTIKTGLQRDLSYESRRQFEVVACALEHYCADYNALPEHTSEGFLVSNAAVMAFFKQIAGEENSLPAQKAYANSTVMVNPAQQPYRITEYKAEGNLRFVEVECADHKQIFKFAYRPRLPD